VGAASGAAGIVAGCWNILVNSPGWPGAGEPDEGAEGAVAGLCKARVNCPGWDVAASTGWGFDAGAATGSGA